MKYEKTRVAVENAVLTGTPALSSIARGMTANSYTRKASHSSGTASYISNATLVIDDLALSFPDRLGRTSVNTSCCFCSIFWGLRLEEGVMSFLL